MEMFEWLFLAPLVVVLLRYSDGGRHVLHALLLTYTIQCRLHKRDDIRNDVLSACRLAVKFRCIAKLLVGPVVKVLDNALAIS